MSAGTTRRSSWVWAVHGSLVVLVVVAAAAYSRSRGEPVARVDLLGTPRAAFVAKGGERLELRSSVRSTLRCSDLDEALQRVTLRVRVDGPDGRSYETSCPMQDRWPGTIENRGAVPPRCGLIGISNRCAVTLESPGDHVVHVTAAWGTLQPTEATVEILRQPGER